MCSELGISPDTTVIFYGDKSNWFACYSSWLFELYGHEKLKILNGERAKWVAEGCPLTKEISQYSLRRQRYTDASLLAKGLKGTTAEEVLQILNDFYLEMGLQKVLTNQRLIEIDAILAHMKRLA